MRHRWVFLLLAIFTATVEAQWLNFRTPDVPRTRDGQPDLAAPLPRTADKRPDLSGVWMHAYTPVAEMRTLFGPLIDEAQKVDVPGMELGTVHKYAISILADFPFNAPPMTPAALQIFQRNLAQRDESRVCSDVPSFTLAGLLSEPIKIVQAPRLTLVLYEAGNLHRQIYADGRSLPRDVNFPAFLGYSAGRWDGDVFVVETAGFNDKTPLDILGHPHSDALRVTERFRRSDYGHMDIETTFDDPQMYTKPFTIKVPHTLQADADLFESFCENERDRDHLANARQAPAPAR